jgi:acetoin utilization deacetylase AcuC-like enzyme
VSSWFGSSKRALEEAKGRAPWLDGNRRRRLLRAALDRMTLRSSRRVPIFYDPDYRLPLTAVEATMAIEPRRADFIAWYLLESGQVDPAELRLPRRLAYADLARVHSPALLESLGRPETLARIYAVDPSDVPVDELMKTVRLACGGTLDAAREALRGKGPAFNLLGGFHHAAPDKGAGMCPVNDIAVALSILRSEGLSDKVVVLDTDAHPPDGLAACFRGDPTVWIGSLSGSHWTTLDDVDETVLPNGCKDERYLRALAQLLGRMPEPVLAFVIAGGDVLHGDRMGKLGLTLRGARRRDLMMAEVLEGVPSVWLPGGGYHRDAWKVLAGTALAVSRRSKAPIPEHYDPLSMQYARIWQGFGEEHLGSDFGLDDLESSLRLGARGQHLLLGTYSAEGFEYVLEQTQFLSHLRRLGFDGFRVEIDAANPGSRVRLFGRSGRAEHVLLEAVLERTELAGAHVLYIHWLSLRNPKARFSQRRPQLPGQDLPGLGMAREAGQLMAHMARQVGLSGVSFRPAWYHMAYSARQEFRYVDPLHQGRFEAILRDLGEVPLREATLAFAQGRVLLNGGPYLWEAGEMAHWLDERRGEDRDAVDAERERSHFSLVPRAAIHSRERAAPEQT